MLNSKKLIKSIFVVALFTLPTTYVSASTDKVKLQLKTSAEEVNGVREIESGAYQEGIRKTQASLNKLTVKNLRAPLLTNLCVAYIATQNFRNATKACDESIVASKRSTIALNNRAVLHYLTGDLQASVEDLTAAQGRHQYQQLIDSNLTVLRQQALVAATN